MCNGVRSIRISTGGVGQMRTTLVIPIQVHFAKFIANFARFSGLPFTPRKRFRFSTSRKNNGLVSQAFIISEVCVLTDRHG